MNKLVELPLMKVLHVLIVDIGALSAASGHAVLHPAPLGCCLLYIQELSNLHDWVLLIK